MDAHCSPDRPKTCKHVHPTAKTRPKAHTDTLVGRVGPTQNHANIVTQMCGANIATAAAAALMMVPLDASEVHAACAQQPHRLSAVRASDIAHGRGHGQAYGWGIPARAPPF